MNGAKADTITVFVRGNHGELHLLTNLSWSSNTNEIFSQMNARTGVPCSVMRLLLGQKAIEPNQTLKKSGITNESLINLSVRGNGGGKGNHDPSIPCLTTLAYSCCGAAATCCCDMCGKFCDECLERRHRHPSRAKHSAKVQSNFCLTINTLSNVTSDHTGHCN